MATSINSPTMAGIQASAIREMFPLLTRPNLVSFALGLPAPEFFPLADMRSAVSHALADPQALQYSMPSERLKRHIQQLMALRGVKCSEKQIFLTSGGQHATHLLVNLLLQHGQQVLVEELTYEGLHLAIQPLHPEILTVPTEPGAGLDMDAIEAWLLDGARPAFMYAITDGHNPLGLSLSREKRVRLIELARRFCVPIIEDDVFGFINYDAISLPPMRASDNEWVFYVGSFSKILAPALRLGWIVAPAELMPSLSLLKHASDLDVGTLGHSTALAYLDAGQLPGHLNAIRKNYRLRRNTMLRALEAHFPAGTHWKKPSTGMFIWVELPREIDTVELLRVAVATEQVAFMPGPAFAAPNQPCSRNGIRLNFTYCRPELIEDGIARLASVLSSVGHVGRRQPAADCRIGPIRNFHSQG